MKTSLRLALASAVAAVALAGCSAAEPASTAETSPTAAATMSVTSADFADGGALPEWASANAFNQCEGANENPQLAWSGAPDGTVAYAITLTDSSASDWPHWVHVNVPASVTSVERAGADSLPGEPGTNNAGTVGYFGPCPPNGPNTYIFTIYALDAELDWDPGFGVLLFRNIAAEHVLAQATITGTFTRN